MMSTFAVSGGYLFFIICSRHIPEIQPVYARWRSITHATLRSKVTDKQLSDYLVTQVNLMGEEICFAGSLWKGFVIPNESIHHLFTLIGPQLREVAIATQKLSVQIKEKVITKDYMSWTPDGRSFRKDTMALPYKFSPPTGGDEVVATVRMGVLARLKQSRENGESKCQVLHPPHVVTVSLLQDLLQPPVQTP